MPYTAAHLMPLYTTNEVYFMGGVVYVEPYTKPWWFAYMWREARTQQLPFTQEQNALLPFLNGLYLLPPEWATYQNGRAPDLAGVLRARTTWEQLDGNVLQGALNALFGLGFIQVPAAQVANNDVYGWRGDNRDFNVIQIAGGLINKADTNANNFAAARNMRANWNPISVDNNRANFLYRKNQNDNCTETSVSLAKSIQVGCCFPRLFDVQMRPPDNVQFPAANVAPPNGTLLSRVQVRTQTHNDPFYIARFVDRVQLYFCVVPIGDDWFDTEDYQANTRHTDGFPEFAVKRIPAANIVGSVMARRVWHSLDENDGFTILIDNGASLAPPPPTMAQVEANDPIVPTLIARQTAYAQATDAAHGNSFRWTATGAEGVPALAITGPGEHAAAAVTAILAIDDWP